MSQDDNTRYTYKGVSFTGLLTLLFIALKLTGYIDWSWWWVLSPILIGTALSVAVIVVCILILALPKK